MSMATPDIILLACALLIGLLIGYGAAGPHRVYKRGKTGRNNFKLNEGKAPNDEYIYPCDRRVHVNKGSEDQPCRDCVYIEN